MNKKGLGLSIGLASVIAVGTFVSPYMSSTMLAGKGKDEENNLTTTKYSVSLNDNKISTEKSNEESREKVLKEIRNSQVRNVLNDSNNSTKKIINNNVTSEKSEVVVVETKHNTKKNEVDSTYKKTTVDNSKKESSLNNSENKTKVEIAENKTDALKAKKSEVASLTTSRNAKNEEENIYSNITRSTTGDLYVRKGSSVNSEILGVLPKDAKVVIKDDKNEDWAKIEYNNEEAYISKHYLTNSSKENKEVKKEEKSNKQKPESKPAKSLNKVNMWVKSPVYFRSGKSIQSDKLNVLEKNTKISGVVEDGWFKTEIDGKVGYVSAKYLSDSATSDSNSVKQENTKKESKKEDKKETKKETNFSGEKFEGYVSDSVNVRDNPSMNSNVISVLDRGTKISGIKGEYWTKISEGRYISNNYIQNTKPSSQYKKPSQVKDQYNDNSNSRYDNKSESGSGSAVAQAAYKYLGERYVWGCSQPGVGFDCSGLTSYLYNKVCGISLYRNSAAQANNGYQVSRDNLKQGDLLFFNTNGSGISHVGIYVGNGKMIHASTPSTGVIISDINSNYYTNAFVTARRILN